MYPYKYTFYDFESWLIKNKPDIVSLVFSKIFGMQENVYAKYIQFGSGAYLQSDDVPHIVTGHINPDADAIASSFFSWMLACITRVSRITNVWSICGRISSREIKSMFTDIFGDDVFEILSVIDAKNTYRAISLPWSKLDAKEISNYKIIAVNANSSIHDVSAKVASSECDYVGIAINEDSILGYIPLEYIKNLQDDLAHISLRDFNDVKEGNIVGNMTIKSIIDHHKPCMHNKVACSIRISDNQSCASMMIADLYEILQKHTHEHLELDRNFVISSICILTLAMLDDTDGFDRLFAGDFYSMARAVAIFDWIKNSEVILKPCFDVMGSFYKDRSDIKKNHSMFSGFLNGFSLLKQKSINDIIHDVALLEDEVNSEIFADTKVQNDICIVTQIKLMEENRAEFSKHRKIIENKWLAKCKFDSIDIDNKMQIIMISTLGAVSIKSLKNCDEWWIWSKDLNSVVAFVVNIANSELGINVIGVDISSSQFSDNSSDIKSLFEQKFEDISIDINYKNEEMPSIILKVVKSSMNARKKCVSPYLPNEKFAKI